MSDERSGGYEPPPTETPQQAQLRLLQRRFAHLNIVPGPETWERDGVAFHYEKATLLVKDEYLSQAQARLAGAEIDSTPVEGRGSGGYTKLQIGDDVPHALGLLEQSFGYDVAAPNHLVHISPPKGVGGNCPASEPIPVPAGTPPLPGVECDPEAGRGVRVVVADTGLDPGAASRSPWMAGVTGDPDEGILEEPMTEYAGHGTFIAGVIRCLAPAAEVHVRATFEKGGAVLEDKLVEGLISILDNDYPDIISLSAGTWTHTSQDLLSLQLFGRRRLRLHKGVLLVAAAGNDNQRWPFWPAAAPYAVSVGALDPAMTGKAAFSNFGHWVDAYAPGDELINAFPVGTYIGEEGANKGVKMVYEGMAKWSGTSFATPVVAGLAAARMSRTGENGVDAARKLILQGQKQAIRGLGAVLRPGDA